MKVNFRTNNDQLEIAVEDNGIGFDFSPEQLRIKGQSYGLFSIQERITDLGGELVVDSEIGKGSKIKMIIPLKETN